MHKLISSWISLESYETKKDFLDVSNLIIYHNKDWLDFIGKIFAAEIEVIHTTIDGECVCLTPYIIKKKLGISISGSPLRGTYTEVLGPILKSNLNSETTRLILSSQHKLLKKNNSYIEVSLLNGIDVGFYKDIFSELGYTYKPKYSIEIDLTMGVDNLWSSFKSRARNMIRKAEKSNICAYTVIPDDTWINDYYRILTETFSRQNLPVPHPKRFYMELRRLNILDTVKFVEVKSGPNLISAGIFIFDYNLHRMLYLSGVSNSEGMRLAASSLIQWHIMKEAIGLEIKQYDMGGLGISSIDKFKSSFGGTIIQHHGWFYRSRFFATFEKLLIYLSKSGIIKF